METTQSARIALIEDDEIVRQATTQWLQLAGFDVVEFGLGNEAFDVIQHQAFDAIISDVRLPDIDGIMLLEKLIDSGVSAPVLIITGHGDVDMAVKALHLGAFDFIEKPFQPDRLSSRVSQAVEQFRAQTSTQLRGEYLASLSGLEKVLVGQSEVMKRLREQVARIALIDTNVIIYGETGCGKELVANSLHKGSGRKSHQFVPINCGAIPENLFESELFGHEAGAFTGAAKKRIGKLEYADKGTLFLDEIESMPAAMQVKVLRSLQENTVERVGGNKQINIDLRVVAAAKEDLREHPEFRQDLYYRLNVAQIYIPPLRERGEDILTLFEHFAKESNRNARSVSDADKKAMMSYGWPGNVRELRNVATRFALDNTMSVLEILSNRPVASSEPNSTGVPLAVQLHNFERKVLEEALTRHQGRINDVMQELDLPRRTLNQKMQKFGLNRSDFTDP
ncbi:C4-dicarboxylate transport transcriptional regulatory protein DctD [Grimontia celer]|uniref:C4-dicarboxylate transport transcriptional regulatory protein DctD n=1 Tax=Grimontia celer TaxID=1796497 RepID=A0A128F499_9GAMM|nr:sigma-54 dependent transcriptional regulator [Grimontia celer]CZF81121.1 C4-dicarboxylate transport transcriptional regulatory protein DctD [Grimontia celer]